MRDVDRRADVCRVGSGEVLRAEWLDPLGITPYRLAKDIDVPANRVTAILAGERAITADTALRLARYFETSAEFWLNLQTLYDLRTAQAKVGSKIAREVKARRAA